MRQTWKAWARNLYTVEVKDFSSWQTWNSYHLFLAGKQVYVEKLIWIDDKF